MIFSYSAKDWHKIVDTTLRTRTSNVLHTMCHIPSRYKKHFVGTVKHKWKAMLKSAPTLYDLDRVTAKLAENVCYLFSFLLLIYWCMS